MDQIHTYGQHEIFVMIRDVELIRLILLIYDRVFRPEVDIEIIVIELEVLPDSCVPLRFKINHSFFYTYAPLPLTPSPHPITRIRRCSICLTKW